MGSSDFVLGAFAAACFIGLLALARLVHLQDRIEELTDQLDDAKAELDAVQAAQEWLRTDRENLLDALARSQREKAEAEDSVTFAQDILRSVYRGLNAVAPYGVADIPDAPHRPRDDAPAGGLIAEVEAFLANPNPQTGEDS